MFFVLSGFLISWMLLKERKKYGDIDVWHFYRGRFFRLWPALFIWVVLMITLFDQGNLNYLLELIFLNNINFGKRQPPRHTWSVAIEF